MRVFYGEEKILNKLEDVAKFKGREVRCFSSSKSREEDLLDFIKENRRNIEVLTFLDVEDKTHLSRKVDETSPKIYQIGVVREKSEDQKKSRLDLILEKEKWLSEWILKKVEERSFKEKSEDLKKALSSADGEISIFVHDDPDPDAIASAIALEEICSSMGMESTTYFGGSIGHPENEIFLENTEFVIENVDRESAREIIDKSTKIAFIDFAETSGKRTLPEEIEPDIIIDHHYTNRKIQAKEYDEIRSDVGATSTMMTKHMLNLDIKISPLLAAALLFGIKVDTNGYTKNMSPADYRAMTYLSVLADKDLLNIIHQRAPIYSETLDAMGRAIMNRKVEKNVLTAFSGSISHPDDLSQIADTLLKERDILTVLVYGIKDDKIHMSARSEDLTVNVGKIMEKAYSNVGEGGGHAHAAGGIVPLDRFDDEKEAEERIAELFIDEVCGS